VILLPESLIGVDGGASGVRAYRLDPMSFAVLESREELYEGRDWVEVCARVIGPGPARVAFAMPGVKTADRRGIERLTHAAAVPDFLDRLASLLPEAVLGPLESDGEMAVLGETVAPGQLVGVSCGYYLGGGTGLSEGLLVDGRSVPVESVVSRAWELGLEPQLSPGGWKALFEGKAGRPPVGSLEEEAASGGLAAVVLRTGARNLTEFLARRVKEFASLGVRLEKIVLGQRFGRLMRMERLFYVSAPVPVVGSEFRAAPAVGAAIRLTGRPV
jgi:hypothetical protein